jgi:hypothetical protein
MGTGAESAIRRNSSAIIGGLRVGIGSAWNRPSRKQTIETSTRLSLYTRSKDANVGQARQGAQWHMVEIGAAIDETGLLVRDGGGFILRRDIGGVFKLELHRMPIDHIEKRVRVTGILIGDDVINVEGLMAA